MKTTISALAELELNDAAQYYELSQQGLAEKFFSAFSETLAKIKMNPKAGCSYNKMTRYQMLNRFPYSVFYTTKNNEIVIVAIVHQHRMPGYWLSRINDNDISEPEAVYSATILANGRPPEFGLHQILNLCRSRHLSNVIGYLAKGDVV